MQRLGLNQSLQQKLSPQQIQFIKLLQVPTAELEQRVEEELELNPVLEEGSDDNEAETPETQETEAETETPEKEETPETQDDAPEEPTSAADEDIDIKDYLRDDDYSGYKTYDGDDDDDKEMPIATSSSLQETLITQLGFLVTRGHALRYRQTTHWKHRRRRIYTPRPGSNRK